MNHLMLDIETLGPPPRGALVSVGAVLFDQNKPNIQEKYWVVDHLGCFQNNNNRIIDKSTLIWWMNQSEEARAVFKVKDGKTIEVILEELALFIKTHSVSCVWANGTDFDLAILEDCYKWDNREIPWKHKNKCCMRSIRKLEYLSPELKPWSAYKSSDLSHNALEDAKMQAEYVFNFMQKVKK